MTLTPPATGPLERAVEVMDRLRSPGGCAWDAVQTPRSLTPYLLEETYEVLEAIESDDATLLREELGDLLLQVLFHARIAQERPGEDAFSIDDVAADLVAKLVRRHPHVFADETADSVEELNDLWERRKVQEKGRTSVVDGIPPALPALALTTKLISRARRAGLADVEPDDEPDTDGIGGQLFALVRAAELAGVDAESALRRVAADYRSRLIVAEQAADAGRAGPQP